MCPSKTAVHIHKCMYTHPLTCAHSPITSTHIIQVYTCTCTLSHLRQLIFSQEMLSGVMTLCCLVSKTDHSCTYMHTCIHFHPQFHESKSCTCTSPVLTCTCTCVSISFSNFSYLSYYVYLPYTCIYNQYSCSSSRGE